MLPNSDNDNEAVLKEPQNNFDRHIENSSSKISIFLIQMEIIWEFHKFKRRLYVVMSDYKILQILSIFRGPYTMTFTLQSKFYICACALPVYNPKTSRQILQDNSWTESPGLKNLCAFCSCMSVWSVTYKIQWLDTPPFGHFMRIVHVTEAPSTGAPLFKQAEETQITFKNYRLASTLS